MQPSPETLSSPAPDATRQRPPRGIDRQHALDWYARNRARTRALFDVLTPDTLYAQPIAQRHPIVFYVGHLPGFSLNTLVKRGLRIVSGRTESSRSIISFDRPGTAE